MTKMSYYPNKSLLFSWSWTYLISYLFTSYINCGAIGLSVETAASGDQEQHIDNIIG